MPSLNDVARRHTDLTDGDLERLHLLLSDWHLLADLSFSDLVLWLPTWNGSGYVAGAQVRPTTGPTVFGDDLVGSFLPRGRRPLLDEALEQGEVVTSRGEHVLVPIAAIPVRGEHDQVAAVIARHVDPGFARSSSRLETAYLSAADQLTRMVAQGSFPAPGGLDELDASPRVGDGLLLLGPDGAVEYASPNAQSAYRRLGLASDLAGARLDVVTRQLLQRRTGADEELGAVAGGRAARVMELEDQGTAVLVRSIPLLDGGRRTGALILVRDVTELRRRERELLSKDATIREIHHRVKNNLQTVAALLRLQARRMVEPQGRAALEEAVRRVASIAVVHEMLSATPDETVPFDAIADRLLVSTGEVSQCERRGPAGPAGVVRRAPGRRRHAAGHRALRARAERRPARAEGSRRGGGRRGVQAARRAAGGGAGRRCRPAPGLRPGRLGPARPADRADARRGRARRPAAAGPPGAQGHPGSVGPAGRGLARDAPEVRPAGRGPGPCGA